MTQTEQPAVPRVSRLSIAPVRSLGLEHPESIEVTADGVVEDRRFFLVDDTNRRSPSSAATDRPGRAGATP